jgi:hypothetical protein
VYNVVGLGTTTLLWAREQHRGLEDGACVVDGITGLGRGRWQRVKGLDHGRERRRSVFGEDSTMVRRLQGGLDDGVGSRENFGRKFWQPDGVSKSLQGLGFAKVVQWFIYRGTTVATGIGDVNMVVATMIHISIAPI